MLTILLIGEWSFQSIWCVIDALHDWTRVQSIMFRPAHQGQGGGVANRLYLNTHPLKCRLEQACKACIALCWRRAHAPDECLSANQQ